MSICSKRMSIFFLKILFSILVIAFLIHTSQLKITSLTKLLNNPWWLMSTILLFLLMIVVNTYRWYRLNIAQNIQFSFFKTFLVTYLATGLNSVLPGNVGGDIVRAYYLFQQMPQQKSRILLSVFFDRVIGLMAIFTLLCFIALFQLSLFHQDTHLFYIFLVCTGFSFGGLLVFILSLLLPQKVGVSAWLQKNYLHKAWAKSLISFLEAVRIYRNSKKIILECFLASIVIQILMVITTIIIAHMMNFPSISSVDYMIAIGITQIANLIPATPGGLGLGEAAFSKIIMLLNPAIFAPFATIFIAYRLISVLVYLPAILSGVFLTKNH